MQAEIITVGDEILIGQIVDTNSQWLSQRLNEIGISVYQITSIQDDKAHIIKAVAEAETNADIVILTGGLGPTKDDITKLTLTAYFDDTLVRYPEIEEHIKQLFAKIKYKFTEMDLRQAMLPSRAKILKNELGTASGMWFRRGSKVIISLPGVPNEMKGLVMSSVLPGLQESFKLPFIVHRTLHTYGLGESRVAQRLEAWEDKLPHFIKLAYLPSYGRLRLRLSARGKSLKQLETGLDIEIKKLKILLEDIIIGADDQETLERSINKLLSTQNKTLSLAESCTGGDLSRRITAEPGASKFLRGALVAYDAEIKKKLLGVPSEMIEKFSVVSGEVAREMALQCQKLFGTDYAIATTGNAGPTTDNTDKTVGVVFIAIATPTRVFEQEFYFGQPREKVIERASVKALELLRKEILKNNENSLSD
jgi:nicotinamide-nucleotide amidase